MLGFVEAGDLEEASFVLVENRGEDAWRIEVRQAAPVDRTVHAHQRDRVQVADDTVGLDRLIGHLLTGLSNFRRYRRKKPPFCPSPPTAARSAVGFCRERSASAILEHCICAAIAGVGMDRRAQ